MNQSELEEHRNYLADERKVQAYRAALEEIVAPGDTVLDLGTGTGLLGMLACQAGAEHVIAVEYGRIIDVARDVAQSSGFGDRITHIRCHSNELTLDAPVDVAVCDQIGGFVHDAGVLTYFNDVRARLLKPGGAMIPGSFELMAAPVTFDKGRAAVDFWRTSPAGFDTTAAHRIAANIEWHYAATGDELDRLTTPLQITTIDADHSEAITGTAVAKILSGGRLDGLAGWFIARLSPSVTLTNDPWSPERFRRWWNFYPLADGFDVETDDDVEVTFKIHPEQKLTNWSITISRSGDQIGRFSHSTFLSGPLLATDRGNPVPKNLKIEQMQAVLAAIDGTKGPAEIANALADRVGSVFATQAQLEGLIARIVQFAARAEER